MPTPAGTSYGWGTRFHHPYDLAGGAAGTSYGQSPLFHDPYDVRNCADKAFVFASAEQQRETSVQMTRPEGVEPGQYRVCTLPLEDGDQLCTRLTVIAPWARTPPTAVA
jgi:hypothetical protein